MVRTVLARVLALLLATAGTAGAGPFPFTDGFEHCTIRTASDEDNPLYAGSIYLTKPLS